MAHDYIPKRDQLFLDWSRTFSGQINAAPEQFGLTPLLAGQYAELHDAYAAALKAAHNRARTAIAAKRAARAAAEKQARALVRIIQAHPGTTNETRIAISITLRHAEQTPIARPVDRPEIIPRLLFGSTARITVRQPRSSRRGKPHGVAGAIIYSYIGDAPPRDLAQWKQTATTKPRCRITFGPDIQPGAKVWLSAAWVNPRMQRGPACEPKFIHVACSTMLLDDAGYRMAA